MPVLLWSGGLYGSIRVWALRESLKWSVYYPKVITTFQNTWNHALIVCMSTKCSAQLAFPAQDDVDIILDNCAEELKAHGSL